MTELRVHGVGGAAPETIMDVPYSAFVSGDPDVGFFAAPSEVPHVGPRRRIEAYSWGGLTSRSAARALWVLLLPYALVNVGGWLLAGQLRTTSGQAFVDRWRTGVVRVFALLVTVTLTTYVSVAAIDVYALQCGGQALCTSSNWGAPLRIDWVSDSVGHRLLLGAMIPLGLSGTVALLTRLSHTRVHLRVSTATETPRSAFSASLDDPGFWSDAATPDRLGLAHLTASLATVGFAAGSAAADLGGTGWLYSPYVFGAFLAVAVVLSVAIRLPRSVAWIALSGVVLMLALLANDITDASLISRLGANTGTVALANPLYYSQISLLGLLGIGAVLSRTHQSRLRDRLVPIAVLLLGWNLVMALGSGAIIQLATFLGQAIPDEGPGLAVTTANPVLEYNPILGVTAVNAVVFLIAMTFVGTMKWVGAGTKVKLAAVYTEYKAHPDTADEVASTVRRAWVSAAMTDQAASVLVWSSAVIAILGLTQTLSSVALGSRSTSFFPAAIERAAATFLGLVSLGVVLAVARVFRSRGLRRGVGTIWDILTFWPRWYHPWAPPSYGERAVPQLSHRIREITASGGAVVISAHSQGSVVAVAALQHHEVVDSDLALLTHGSPITRLYRAFFPTHFDDRIIQNTLDALDGTVTPAWINLYRRTDYIGGDIGYSSPRLANRPLLDPPSLGSPGNGSRIRIERHSGYYFDPSYIAALSELVGELQNQIPAAYHRD